MNIHTCVSHQEAQAQKAWHVKNKNKGSTHVKKRKKKIKPFESVINARVVAWETNTHRHVMSQPLAHVHLSYDNVICPPSVYFTSYTSCHLISAFKWNMKFPYQLIVKIYADLFISLCFNQKISMAYIIRNDKGNYH